MTNELDKPIGNEERQKLAAGSVIVKEIAFESKKTKNGEAKLLVLKCLHPAKQELIRLSNIKIKRVQGNNETISKDTLWYHEDSTGNIAKWSMVSTLMNFYGKKTLKEFENTSITTETDAAGFLCIKAY